MIGIHNDTDDLFTLLEHEPQNKHLSKSSLQLNKYCKWMFLLIWYKKSQMELSFEIQRIVLILNEWSHGIVFKTLNKQW